MPTAQVGERTLRFEPLWVRVDRNRVRLASFVVLFVGGSAALLTLALVAVPGVLIGWGFGVIELVEPVPWFARLPWVVAACFGVMLLIGGLIAAVQLANAHDWVTSRFQGRMADAGEEPGLESAIADMALAAGLPQPPGILLLPTPAVNALAIGTSRARPVIGVTRGFLDTLDTDEQRAVIATLTARIVAGDILFGTALAALMGPIKAVRDSRFAAGSTAGCAADSCTSQGCSGADLDGCSGCADLGSSDDAGGCLVAIGIAVFLAVVAAITYAAVLTAAWIVTLWGRALHRASYEKADAEGMLLLKDPAPMLSALGKVITSETGMSEADASYDGIFYAPTSGTTAIVPHERARFDRLCEVLGVEGAAASIDAAIARRAETAATVRAERKLARAQRRGTPPPPGDGRSS
ncbi:MAG: M48 family metalloprotease [Coriobacteriia bacterium]|nr:M48 family metalloprotease [Coriobacteriia bacterium]